MLPEALRIHTFKEGATLVLLALLAVALVLGLAMLDRNHHPWATLLVYVGVYVAVAVVRHRLTRTKHKESS